MMRWIDTFRDAMAVQRAHTMRTIDPRPTVGEHTANAIAMALYLLQRFELTGIRERVVMLELLFHDVEEIYTGDIPAPVKTNNPGFRHTLTDVEVAWRRVNMPETPALTPPEHRLAKAADMLEFMAFCVQERQMGNRLIRPHFHKVEGFIVEFVDDVEDPQNELDIAVVTVFKEYQEKYYVSDRIN